MRARLIAIILSLSVCSAWAELSAHLIDGTGLPAGTIVLTIDDGPWELWQSRLGNGVSDSLVMADYLASVQRRGRNRTGVPATWFIVGCHFRTQPPSTWWQPMSTLCLGSRDLDENLIEELQKRGFVVGNHTHSHIPASELNDTSIPEGTPQPQRDTIFLHELCQTQTMLVRNGQRGWHLFRPPGLDWPDWAASVANSDPCLSDLEGPVGADVGGAFQMDDGTTIGGDWDCPRKGLSAEQCGDLYLRDIRKVTRLHGAIVLLHDVVNPASYELALIRHIIENLDEGIRIVDIRTHPAFARKEPLYR